MDYRKLFFMIQGKQNPLYIF